MSGTFTSADAAAAHERTHATTTHHAVGYSLDGSPRAWGPLRIADEAAALADARALAARGLAAIVVTSRADVRPLLADGTLRAEAHNPQRGPQ